MSGTPRRRTLFRTRGRRARGRDRAGKVFGVGIMLFYVIAAASALVLCLLKFNGALVPENAAREVGGYQGALLSAYERADEKVYYLVTGGRVALDAAVEQLYADQASFFTRFEGDGVEGLACGTYGYQLWNTKTEACLVGDGAQGLFTKLASALQPVALDKLGEYASRYPGGAIPTQYELNAKLVNQQLRFLFQGQRLEEPILYGLTVQDGQLVTRTGATPSEVQAVLDGTRVVQGLSWPAANSREVSSCFGPRVLSYASSNIHYGFDIPTGGSVLAAMDGTVINDPQTSQYGVVWIQHSPTLSTRYLHLDKASIQAANIKKGSVVHRGTLLGRASDTGCAAAGCGIHLHFEVLVKSVPGSRAHAYAQSTVPGWYNVNPVCFFDDATLENVHLSSTATTCSQQANWKREWCAEYGFTLAQGQAYTFGTAVEKREPDAAAPTTVEQPAAGGDVGRPSMEGLTTKQQDKLSTTYNNLYQYSLNQYIVKASAETGVDQALLRGIITQESLGDPLAISSTGCAGVSQWCIDNADKSKSTAAKMFGSGEYLTFCQCKSTRALPGSGCRCEPSNDRRLVPEYAIPAQAKLVENLLGVFGQYPDRTAFAVAAYNGGETVVRNAITGLRSSDPSWSDVAAYMTNHPEILPYKDKNGQPWPIEEKKAKVAEITNYVSAVLAYTAAWGGNVPPDAGRAAALEAAGVTGSVSRFGTYTHDPSFIVDTPDKLTPFVNLALWADATLQECSKAERPGTCLVDAGAKATPAVSRTCEDAGAQYFFELYQALRDCRENGQTACQCALPAPPSSLDEGTYEFTIKGTGDASLLVNNVFVPGLSFTDLAEKTVRVDDGSVADGIVPENIIVKVVVKEGSAPEYSFTYKKNDEKDLVLWQPGWTVEKSAHSVDHLLFREDASPVEQCAPVKTKYALCSKVVDDMPAVRFALTVKDDVKPEPVTGLTFNPETGEVTFASSTSKDASFYNVYTEDPNLVGPRTSDEPLKPVLQLRPATVTSFDGAAYKGKLLYVTTIDEAENEGASASVTIPAT